MLHEYHVIYSDQYYLWVRVTAVGLGMYTCGQWGTTVLRDFIAVYTWNRVWLADGINGFPM
jgi:hypothetical protein